uniref:non-specific serine/threonine protein kinase n=1 Tax=Fagus sylvatica TaxID=28930 RepID=A0A2N9J920_FAGSY
MAFVHPPLFVFLLIILLPFSSVAKNNGYVTVGNFLTATDNTTSNSWLSPSGDFAFGFHPLKEKDLFLLSIWFAKIPDKTIVWYPTEYKPAVRGSKVELIADRGLVLTTPQGKELWTSNTPGTLYGVMNNAGNFLLEDSDFSMLWDSFKYPIDTLLPAQIIEGREVLSSRQSETNFSKGRFQLSHTTAGDSGTSSPGKQLVFNESGYMYILRDNGKTVPLKQVVALMGITISAPLSQIEGQCVNAPRDTPYLIQMTNWPNSDYAFLKPFTEDQCRKSCMEDCMCAVAIFRLGDSCWKKKLPLSNGKVDSSLDGGKAFIKIRKNNSITLPDHCLSIPEAKKNNKDNLILMWSILLGGSVFVNIVAICFGVFFIYHKKLKRPLLNVTAVEMNLRSFTYKELVEATDGFKEELGKGAFGVVYKGSMKMSSNVLVTVKKLKSSFQDSEKEFKTEVTVIGQTHHKNLVRLLGFCDEGQQRLLVYEFMSNDTLASFLFGDLKPNWNQRIHIAIGIARGLLYLHEECSTQIIHCDIKPQNILLDGYYNARISDFGLAKRLIMDQSKTHTNIRGTKGYVAPEWFRNMPVTAKEGTLDSLVEYDAEALDDRKKLERFVMVAIWCIQEDPSLRPTMRRATQMLEGGVKVLVPPCPYPW